LADLAVRLAGASDNVIVDAAGPETFTFADCVRLIARAIGRRGRIVYRSPGMTYWLTAIAGRLVGDVVLTRDEIAGLMADLLVSDDPPNCGRRFTDWLRERGDALGACYVSELARHYT
jgi:NADH dehydrogenase